MAWNEVPPLKYFTFELFDEAGVTHGLFSRHGGVSPSPWESLNTGGLSGDARENVIENRRRIFTACQRPVESIFDVWQVHSAEVILANQPRPLEQPHQKGDAIVTNRREITLFMRFGDCVPILLVDPIRQVVGMAHAGWQGTVKKIVRKTVETMVSQYHCNAQDLLAGIGPSICVRHYEFNGIGLEQVREAFKEIYSEVVFETQGKSHFDLWNANHLLLLQSGLKPEHVQISGICTAENIEDWYSHRAEKGKTGRFGALLALK